MPISNCPFCGSFLPYVLEEGIVFCGNCEHMVESSYENKMLIAFRIINKTRGKKNDQIKLECKLDDHSWDILINAVDECFTFQEFQLLLKRMSSS